MRLDLSRVREREALVDRRKPHWQRLRPGCYVGFCPSTKEGAGTWSARAYDEERQRYRQKALGHLGSVPSRDQFALAKKEAEAFAIEVETGGLTEEKIETSRMHAADTRSLIPTPWAVSGATCTQIRSGR